jgi:photosystem II PsbW protein
VRPVASLKAQVQKAAQKAALAAVTAPALLAASPAFALVDDRLNGDGTGRALGINDPTLGWVMLGAFTTIWALYYVAQRDETINTDLYGNDMDDEVNRRALGQKIARFGVMAVSWGVFDGPPALAKPPSRAATKQKKTHVILPAPSSNPTNTGRRCLDLSALGKRFSKRRGLRSDRRQRIWREEETSERGARGAPFLLFLSDDRLPRACLPRTPPALSISLFWWCLCNEALSVFGLSWFRVVVRFFFARARKTGVERCFFHGFRSQCSA